MHPNFFFTDWEGPWVITDFAYEAAVLFLNNPEFFERLSQYDDYLSYVEKREGYEAGDTLKLLAPFLVAADVTSRELETISLKLASFTPDAKLAMKLLPYRAVVISTAYKQFLEKTAEMMEVDCDLWGTDFKAYEVREDEKKMVLKAVDAIASLPKINVKPSMRKSELDESSKKSIRWLDKFFWEELAKTSFEEVLKEMNPIGGRRKQKIVQRYAEEHGIGELIAIGDSISDYVMLEWVRERGIAISFNGNEFAIEHANVAIVSNTAFSEAAMVDLFMRKGTDEVERCAKNFEPRWLKDKVNPEIVQGLLNSDVRVYWLEDIDRKAVFEESMRMRRMLRGEAGKLG